MTRQMLIALLDLPEVKKKILDIVEEDREKQLQLNQDALDEVMNDTYCYGGGLS